MKKLLAIIICVCMMLSVFCVHAFSAEADDTHDIISFDTSCTGWTDFSEIYFHIWEKESCQPFFLWYSKSEQGVDMGNGIYSYDLTAHGIKPESDKTYYVVFFNENMKQTYNTPFTVDNLGDTAFCDVKDIDLISPIDNTILIAKWKNSPNVSVPTDTLNYTFVYKEQFEKYIGKPDSGDGTGGISYAELLNYFSDDNSTDTPDWVLCSGNHADVEAPALCHAVYGDYVITRTSQGIPDSFGYFVYVPSDNKFYRLGEAWSKGIENIEKTFTDCLLKNKWTGAKLIGDNDSDGQLTIIDATYLQLVLAKAVNYRSDDVISEYGMNMGPSADVKYISDFDRDGERTIMDATAIQYRLAKLD